MHEANEGFTEDDFRPEVLFHHPEIYLLEFAGPNAVFVRMTEDTYRQSIFTDRQRIVTVGKQAFAAPTLNLLNLFESQNLPQPPLNFIFHVAHCGSTLLARALDELPELLVYREPAALRQLAVEHAATDTGPGFAAMWPQRLRLVARLLGRNYEKSQGTVVKANVPVNFILPQLMGLNAESRGILLYASLRGYLLSVLKSPQHRQWVGYIVHELAAGIKRADALENVAPEMLSPAQAAACLWHAQMTNYRQLAESCSQVRTLDCEVLFERPADTLAAAFGFFGVDAGTDAIEDIVAGDLFSHHAKAPGVEFNNKARKAERKMLEAELAEQIEEGIAWIAEHVAPGAVPDSLPRPLV